MNIPTRRTLTRAALWLALGVILGAAPARAHCDGMDGPVVGAARQALETGNVHLALIWVRREDEPEITRAFEQALAVRRLGEEAKALADLHFFETLVRVHRTGEGAPYTGLKPAGRDLGPAIPAADRALETGSLDALSTLLTHAVRDGLRQRFQHAVARRDFSPDDVEAGRAYVEAYVAFIHYVERIHEAAADPSAGHYPEHEPAGH